MKVVVNSPAAPEAIGTYSQAIRVGNTVYCSGQIGLDPHTMQLCSEDIKLQIHQVLANLSAVCEASGGLLNNIVKLNVYLTDIKHAPFINEAMKIFFTAPYPARAMVQVSALPAQALVEMEAILVLSEQGN